MRVGKLALPYLFLLPAVIILFGLLIFPVVTGIVMSLKLTTLAGETSWVGLQNFVRMFGESRFLGNLRTSLIYVLGNVGLSTPLAYMAAVLITSKLPQATFFRSIWLLPWIIAPVVSTLLWRSMVDPRIGPITKLVEWIAGEQVILLSKPGLAMLFIILHSFWRSFPFVMLFIAAGLATIPEEIYESATVDGAGPLKKFFNITFPMTSNQLGLSLLMITMWTLHDAESIYAFTEGGPGYATETLAVRLFKMSFINFDLNLGSTIGVILIGISAVFMYFYFKLAISKGGEQ